ncbi:methyltransferase domain-containing protein [Listeria weihenstephanensis]|uniref:Methyltransferase domain-containing protein n=1 Tax=Listeria weihenstephanensis TaxID=1006155 RepID=A0A841Z4W8_9LIST|nr:methyltransferase domain-containing protein [Listeria weihenstephanensis]MBC1499702.1 methyltransferase domain-containing protein [Listeria weihenstephanensis]
MNKKTEKIVACMLRDKASDEIQTVQTGHRIKLVEFWDIKEGDRVLEVGCGQGDTTAVLAYQVGETGSVFAVDIASPDYGAPFTLAQSTYQLLQSELGSRIEFQLETDILRGDLAFDPNVFDVAVISHASWYFSSKSELLEMLKILKKWAKRICFAEWNPHLTDARQESHLLAVLVQAQYEAFKSETESNVRTFITPDDIVEMAQSQGWQVTSEGDIWTREMQDAGWEASFVVHHIAEEIAKQEALPAKFKELLLTQANLIQVDTVLPMSSYCCVIEG